MQYFPDEDREAVEIRLCSRRLTIEHFWWQPIVDCITTHIVQHTTRTEFTQRANTHAHTHTRAHAHTHIYIYTHTHQQHYKENLFCVPLWAIHKPDPRDQPTNQPTNAPVCHVHLVSNGCSLHPSTLTVCPKLTMACKQKPSKIASLNNQSINQSIHHYFIVRPKVDQRAATRRNN